MFISLCKQIARFIAACCEAINGQRMRGLVFFFGGGMCESNALNHSWCNSRSGVSVLAALVSASRRLNYDMTDKRLKHLFKCIFESDDKM